MSLVHLQVYSVLSNEGCKYSLTQFLPALFEITVDVTFIVSILMLILNAL